MATLLQDLRYGLRMLAKNPGFTAVAVITLALGIGANTAIFSVIDSVLLRPLPYPEADRLALASRMYRGRGMEELDTSQDGRTWESIRDHASSVDRAVFSGGFTGVNFVAQGKPQYVMQQRVGAGFFRVLGVSPLVGREFTADEDRPGGAAVTVLSYRLWKHVFNADTSIIGRAVTLRGEPYTVVGVMPRNFRTSVPADLWTPLRPSATGEGGGTNYGIVVRLRPGATWAQANGQIGVIGEPILRGYRLPPDVSARLGLIPLQQGLTQDVRKPLLILWAAVGLVLLIACTNTAGLLLARATSRLREIATRMALGGGRAAIVRQLFAESLLLACAGGLCGIGLGYGGLEGLKLLGGETFTMLRTVTLDARVLLATAFLSLMTSVLFGLAPALYASRVDIRSALVASGGRGIAGGANPWPRRLLVVGEVALGMILLIGAGLLIRTLVHLRGLNAGFDPANVITAKLSLQDARYTTVASVNRLFDKSLARIHELPGVESAAVVLGLPYERLLNMGFRRMDGPAAQGRPQMTTLSYTTQEYFLTLRIPLLRGRGFTSADRADSAPVVIVNQAFVKAYLQDREALGSHIGIANGSREIVGVVEDTQQRPGWGNYGPLAPMPLAYIPASQTSDGFLKLVHTWFSPNWVVRTSAPVEGTIAGMQRAVEAVDPQLPFAAFRSMGDVRSESLAFQRLLMTLLGVMAGLALLLAAVGIYGLIANSVVERTHEIGIRVALGAERLDVLRLVIGQGLRLAVIGTGSGLAAGLVLTRFLRSMLFGVKTNDPATLAGVVLTLIAVALLASYIPARRATKVDPMVALRYE